MSVRLRILLLLLAIALCLYLLVPWDSTDPASLPDTGNAQSSQESKSGSAKTGRSQSSSGIDVPQEVPLRGPESLSVTDREGLKRSGAPPELDKQTRYIEVALYSDDVDERTFAISELSLLDPTPAIMNACFRLLKDEEEDVREETVLTLEILEDPAAIPALERVLREDSSPDIRAAAQTALRALQNKKTQPPLE